MSFSARILDVIVHLDRHLAQLFDTYGPWAFGIVCLIIFLESGLVLTPVLPGDSLLFALGVILARHHYDLTLCFLSLAIAAIAGNFFNYFLGNRIGKWVIEKQWIKTKHIQRTRTYFDRYGNFTVMFARFLPFVRTFAPFLAGVGSMKMLHFSIYTIVGGFIWIGLFLLSGYFLGNIPIVQAYFLPIMMGIVVITVAPVVINVIYHWASGRKR